MSTQEIVIRLLAALLFSGSVGLQRALMGKAAGMRTHILVGVGSALFTMVSGYAFHAVASNADRIAAQIVSGIGFIGGGAILKEGGSIKGLTTAAGLWAAAALGMAAGAGLYVMAAATAVVILLTLVLLRRVEVHFPRRALSPWAVRLTLADDSSVERVRAALAPHCHKVSLRMLEQAEDGSLRLTFAVQVPHHYNVATLTAELRAAGARLVVWRAGGNADGDD